MGVRSGLWAIVVAGGSGARFGGAKQFEELEGRRVVDWSVSAAHSVATAVVLVVPDVSAETCGAADIVVGGGSTRSESVRAGLAVVPEGVGVIVVHDAVRPLADPDLFERVVAAVEAGADAAVPAVPVPDTVRKTGGGTLDRAELVLVQTPQAFAAAQLRRAHRDAPEATDDASLVEAVGGSVTVVEGDAHNLKITRPDDLVVAAALIRRRG